MNVPLQYCVVALDKKHIENVVPSIVIPYHAYVYFRSWGTPTTLRRQRPRPALPHTNSASGVGSSESSACAARMFRERKEGGVERTW